MTDYRVVMRCSICKGEESITLHGYSEEYARLYAELMDGSSPLYASSPRESEDSVIGRCVQCGGLFDSEVQPA